jgi:hypothetical protein
MLDNAAPAASFHRSTGPVSGLKWCDVTRAAEHGGPMIFAQMGMLQAVHRHHKREFNPDRKDHRWGAAS